MTYWTQDFETVANRPETKPESPVTISVTGQGDWIYYWAYKSTNTSYIKDGSTCALRMLKKGSYVITPILNDGVATVSFIEGRGGKSITVSTSTDQGATWSSLTTITSSKTDYINTVAINNPSVNRVKISNDSGNDADIDNVTITRALPPSSAYVSTKAATDTTDISATISGVIADDAPAFIEKGVCYGLKSIPTVDGEKVVATGSSNDFTLQLTGLLARKTYYARTYITTTDGAVLYGNQISFATLKGDGPLIPNV